MGLIATKEQFAKYKKVQMSGKYNMMSREAINAVGVNVSIYADILKNYDKYEEMYG